MLYNKSNQKLAQFNLEALRGFAAIFVVVHHMIHHNQYLDPNFFPKKLKYVEPPGHFCVLIFFVLSGYVIGISNKNKLTTDKILPYIKKRFLRIYPIYFISICITLLIAVPYSFSTILSNFALIQGAASEVIWENNPIWSLNYEVFYYLLFIPISFFGIKPLYVLIGSILIAVGNYILFPSINLPIISSYFYGFAFWSVGLIIAKHIPPKEISIRFSRLCSGIFLILSVNILSFSDNILHKITSYFPKKTFLFPDNIYWDKIIISFYDLSLMLTVSYSLSCLLKRHGNIKSLLLFYCKFCQL